MDNGGYNVHPVGHLQILRLKKGLGKDMKVKELKIEKLLTLGYTTVWRPLKDLVQNTFPNPPNKPGITKKKIIKKAMQCNAYIIEVLVFWRYNPSFPDEYNSILIRTDINVH